MELVEVGGLRTHFSPGFKASSCIEFVLNVGIRRPVLTVVHAEACEARRVRAKSFMKTKWSLGWKWPHGHIMGVEGGIGSD